MSRLIVKYAQQLTCCVAILLAVGAQQFTSAAPIVMCYFDNCFDAGQRFGRESDQLGIARADGQLRTFALTQVGLRPQVADPVQDSLSVITDLALDVPQTVAPQAAESGRTFSLVASSNLSSETTGSSITVQGVTAVPEPTTTLLLGAGLAGLAMKPRKRDR